MPISVVGRQKAPAGSLQLADLGFFSLRELATQDRAGRFWLTHIQRGTALWDAANRRWEVPDLLEQHVNGLTEVAEGLV